MQIVTLNCGSSSLRCSLVDVVDGAVLGQVHFQDLAAADLAPATLEALADLERGTTAGLRPTAFAHRIVHGGPKFSAPLLVSDAVLSELEALAALAPLHNPPALTALHAARQEHAVAHVAIFDTAFHATLPLEAREYALPRDLGARLGLRRYGVHGISHASVMRQVGGYLRRSPRELRLVSCHLGNGASVTAIEHGRSVDTSMGMTPLEGLVMGTRAGDVDPGVLLHLMRAGGYDASRLDALLNHESGLKGLAGTRDMRVLEQRAAGGDEAARLAITVFARRVRKYIGAYAAVMGGVDAIAFTGGIGERSALVRSHVMERLEFLNSRLDADLNAAAQVSVSQPVARISADPGTPVLVVRSDEDGEMARDAAKLLGWKPVVAS